MRQYTILLGLLITAAKTAAATAKGYAVVSVIAPVAVMSSTGLLSPFASSSTGWVSIMIPRAGTLNFQPVASFGTSRAAAATSVDSNAENSEELDDQATSPRILDLPFNDGTLSSSMATSLTVSGLNPGKYSATVAFN